MRQRLRSHLTFANVVSVTALFVALGGTAIASVIITDNSQVDSNTISGHKPPSGKHANLFAGSVNGQDVADNSLTGTDINESSLTGDAHKLVYSATASSASSLATIATVGPYTIKGNCIDVGGGGQYPAVQLLAHGPAGTVNSMFDETRNDNTDLGGHSTGLLIPANSDFVLLSSDHANFNFLRIGGEAMLKTDTGTLVQVDFNAVADDRHSPGTCFIQGTATRAT
jgi:hypothetical protein